MYEEKRFATHQLQGQNGTTFSGDLASADNSLGFTVNYHRRMAASQTPNAYRVFFSHGGEDTYIVHDFFGPKVQASGAEVFVDEGEVSYGDDFRDIVFHELNTCDELLLLLTPSSVQRPWVFAELGAAILRDIHVVAIRYGVSEEELRRLGILSILGTKRLLVPAECDKYVVQLRSRVEDKRNG